MKKDKTYSPEEIIPNCLIRIHDWKVIQRTNNKIFNYLFWKNENNAYINEYWMIRKRIK